jgi:hypothetical protein
MALKNAGKFSVFVCELEPEAVQDGLKGCSFPNSYLRLRTPEKPP